MAAVKNHFLPLFCLKMGIEPMKFAKNGDKYCLIVPQQADKCTCSNSRWLLIAILDFSTFFTTVICLTHILCIYAAHQFWVICFPLAQHMFFFFLATGVYPESCLIQDGRQLKMATLKNVLKCLLLIIITIHIKNQQNLVYGK